MTLKSLRTVTVLGDGAWGTTIAIHLAKKKFPVTLWGAFDANVQHLQKKRENTKFLPGFKFPKHLSVTSNIHEAVDGADLIILATPSEYLEGVLRQLKGGNFKNKVFLSIVKGIHPVTHQRMSEMIEAYLGKVKLAILSGPTIAGEVAAEIPTTAVIACRDLRLAQQLQAIVHSPTFRIYTNTDVIGVEVGGSLKNVIALACGMCDGLGLGTNAKAAVVARGLVEISRLGVALGGKQQTFYGLTGLGDLITTCFSPHSRNRTVGEQLGKGKSITAILKGMPQVAEGVITAKAAYRLSRARKIPMPIVEQVYKIVFEGKNPRKAMGDLMGRSVKTENGS